MATIRKLQLNSDEQKALSDYRDHHAAAYVRERCAALLKIAAGQAPHAVARQGLLKPRRPDTVYGWLNVYVAEGLSGLVGHRQGGNHRRSL